LSLVPAHQGGPEKGHKSKGLRVKSVITIKQCARI